MAATTPLSRSPKFEEITRDSLPRVQWPIGGSDLYVISERINDKTRRFQLVNFAKTAAVLAEGTCAIARPGQCVRNWSKEHIGLHVRMFAYQGEGDVVTYSVVVWTSKNLLQAYAERLTKADYQTRLGADEPDLVRNWFYRINPFAGELPNTISWAKAGTDKAHWKPRVVDPEQGSSHYYRSALGVVVCDEVLFEGLGQETEAGAEDRQIALDPTRIHHIQFLKRTAATRPEAMLVSYVIDPRELTGEELTIGKDLEDPDKLLTLASKASRFIGRIDPRESPALLSEGVVDPAQTFESFMRETDFDVADPSQIKQLFQALLIASQVKETRSIEVTKGLHAFADLILPMVDIELSTSFPRQTLKVLQVICTSWWGESRETQQATFEPLDVSRVQQELLSSPKDGKPAPMLELDRAGAQGTTIHVYISCDKFFGEIASHEGAAAPVYQFKTMCIGKKGKSSPPST